MIALVVNMRLIERISNCLYTTLQEQSILNEIPILGLNPQFHFKLALTDLYQNLTISGISFDGMKFRNQGVVSYSTWLVAIFYPQGPISEQITRLRKRNREYFFFTSGEISGFRFFRQDLQIDNIARTKIL